MKTKRVKQLKMVLVLVDVDIAKERVKKKKVKKTKIVLDKPQQWYCLSRMVTKTNKSTILQSQPYNLRNHVSKYF